MKTTNNLDTITAAAHEFVARKNRQSHPEGTFDKQGRFYPSDREFQACCSSIRTPSRAYPYSYMTHCRTADHVAHLFGVDARDVRKMARQIERMSAVAVAA